MTAEFRPFRTLLGLTLASAMAAAPMIALTIDGDLAPAYSIEIAVGGILGTSWVLWFAGTAVLVATALPRHSLRGGAFKVFGAVVAFLHPLATLAAFHLLLPSILPGVPASGTGETELGSAVGAGLLEIAFGWFGGWIVWRSVSSSRATEVATAKWTEVRRLRFGLAILLLPLILVSVVAAPDLANWQPGMAIKSVRAILPAATVLAFVITPLFLLGLRSMQNGVTRGNCVLLGGVFALLLPAASDPFTAAPTTGPLMERLALFVVIGSVLLPFGLIGGWLLWRIGIGRVTPASAPEAENERDDGLSLTPRHRRWKDLRPGRLSLGLCLGPIVMTALLILIWILDASMTPEEMTYAAIGMLIIAIAWCLVGGWSYLLAVARRRRRIGRVECLLLGLIVADLLPLVTVSLIFATEGWQGLTVLVDDPRAGTSYMLTILAAVEVLFALMGLLNGWLFWRVGVRPAPVPEPDVTRVFD